MFVLGEDRRLTLRGQLLLAFLSYKVTPDASFLAADGLSQADSPPYISDLAPFEDLALFGRG